MADAPAMNPREWCATLGGIRSPSFPKDAIEALVDMIPLILSRYSAAAFNILTLTDLGAMKCRQTIPAFDEVCKVMGEWSRSAMPAEKRLGLDDGLPKLPPQPWRGPTSDDEREAIRAAAAAYRAEVAAKEVTVERPSVTPSYLSGAALALVRSKAGIPLSPELGAALPGA